MSEKTTKARKLRQARHRKQYINIDWDKVRARCKQDVLLQRHALFGTPIKIIPDNPGGDGDI